MVTMDVATIRAALEETYRQNRALIAGLSDQDLERPTPNPKWRVRQLAAHIAEDDGGTVYVGTLLAKGKNAKAPEFLINLVNWWGCASTRGRGRRTSWPYWTQSTGSCWPGWTLSRPGS